MTAGGIPTDWVYDDPAVDNDKINHFYASAQELLGTAQLLQNQFSALSTSTAQSIAALQQQITNLPGGGGGGGGTVDLTGTPVLHYAVGNSYPGRPVTTRPVIWASWEVAPPLVAGTTSSSTGPVDDFDLVMLAPGVVTG